MNNNTANLTIEEIRKQAVWLQNVGACFAKPACELVEGDMIVWNYGSTSKFIGVERKTAKTIWLKCESKDGVYIFKRGIASLVPVQQDGKTMVFDITKDEL